MPWYNNGNWEGVSLGYELKNILHQFCLAINEREVCKRAEAQPHLGRPGFIDILSITRSGNTATATVPVNSPSFLTNLKKVHIAGVDQLEYNGEFDIVVISPTQFTFTVSGSPLTPATGVYKHALGYSTFMTGHGFPIAQWISKPSTSDFDGMSIQHAAWVVGRVKAALENMLNSNKLSGSITNPTYTQDYSSISDILSQGSYNFFWIEFGSASWYKPYHQVAEAIERVRWIRQPIQSFENAHTQRVTPGLGTSWPLYQTAYDLALAATPTPGLSGRGRGVGCTHRFLVSSLGGANLRFTLVTHRQWTLVRTGNPGQVQYGTLRFMEGCRYEQSQPNQNPQYLTAMMPLTVTDNFGNEYVLWENFNTPQGYRVIERQPPLSFFIDSSIPFQMDWEPPALQPVLVSSKVPSGSADIPYRWIAPGGGFTGLGDGEVRFALSVGVELTYA